MICRFSGRTVCVDVTAEIYVLIDVCITRAGIVADISVVIEIRQYLMMRIQLGGEEEYILIGAAAAFMTYAPNYRYKTDAVNFKRKK